MTPPALAAQRFLQCCALGGGLGLWYGFLRPLRRGRSVAADLLFFVGAVWAWLYAGFAVCGGDLRLGYFAALAVGMLIFDWTAGLLLRPLFAGFWKKTGSIFRKTLAPVKNFFKKNKNFICICGKMGYNKME